MGFKVLITDAALEDLRRIVEFVAQDDKEAAVRLGEKLIGCASRLSSLAERCPFHDKLRAIRKLVLPPYLIYYQCQGSTV